MELIINENSTPCQLMNAPIAPMNFTSPMPIASRGSTISALVASMHNTSPGLIFSSPISSSDGDNRTTTFL